jgi:biotin carboxyl carrier protein
VYLDAGGARRAREWQLLFMAARPPRGPGTTRLAQERDRTDMPTEIKMPTLFASNDEGTIARWMVREGQHVNAGDVLAEVVTDEATVDIEAIESGTIIKLLVREGTPNVKANTPIALLNTGAGGGAGVSRQQASAPLRTTPRAPVAPAAAAPASPPRQVPAAPPQAGATATARTRLMGTHGAANVRTDAAATTTPAKPPEPAWAPEQAKTQLVRGVEAQTDPVAGWVVVVKGPGRGGYRPVFVGMNSVGRDPSQRICLDFGDDSISREEHAFITYDDEQRRFYLQHGGKSTLVRVGKIAVQQPTELNSNDMIRVGRTTLRFVSCCGADFSWGDE